MSAIFGIFYLDSRPVESQSLHHMQDSMKLWGSDGAGLWSEGSVGLGHLMLFNTPESLHEKLPLQSKPEHLVLTSAARLDNREDLFQQLNIPITEQNGMPDSVLILKAYEKWETDCTVYLIGDWAFAIWDARKRQLFLARDHFGGTGLYYYQDNNTFIFASSLKGLLALDEVPKKLNPAGIAQRFPQLPRDSDTPYQGITRLTVAQSMKVSATNTEIKHYWQLDDIPEVRFSSSQDYLDAFQHIYQQAINCRLRSYRPVGIMLSCGLDSGSIAALAAKELANKGNPLHAFSSQPVYSTEKTILSPTIGNEIPLVKELCDYVGNIQLTAIDAANVSPLEGIKSVLNILEQTEYGVANMFWYVAMLKEAQRQNIGTMLIGDGGNFTISWDGNRTGYLLSLLKQGHFPSYIREISAWKKINHASSYSLIKSQVMKPLIPENWVRRHGRKGYDGLKILNPDLVRSLIFHRSKSKSNFYTKRNEFRPPVRQMFNAFQSSFTTSQYELGATYGQDMRCPPFDKRVIDFCLGIPQDQYTRDGKERLLLRNAMTDKMPDKILWNKGRGRQAADIGQRILASQSEIESALQQLNQSKLSEQYLNLQHITEMYAKLKSEKGLHPTSGPQSTTVLRGLMIGLFLQRFET